MKQGTEIEGRFKGLRTIFVETPGQFYEFYNRRVELSVGIQHLNIYDINNELDLPRIWEYWFPTQPSFIVTVERSEIPAMNDVPVWIHFVLNVKGTDFFNLREMDQIKFEQNRYVHMGTKEVMMKAYPSDFYGDEDI